MQVLRRMRWLTMLAGVCGAALLAGCTRVAPVRTLPNWVRGVYVPVVKNESFEPGLEIAASKAVQEAFLQDGRVDIVPKKFADLIVVATIEDFQDRSARSSGDHINTNENIKMIVDVQLFQPLDMDKPLAKLPKLIVTNSFLVDVRSSDFVSEEDRKENLMNQLGSQVVNQVINGFPAALANAPASALVPTIISPDQVTPETPLRPRSGADYH